MAWYEKLGFWKDPFELDPFEAGYPLLGMEKQAKEILYRIDSGSMLLIEGRPGSGKTALLKHAIDNFRGEGKVVYIDGSRLSKRLDVSRLLKKKGMILLMDNVQNLSRKNNERIKYYFDQDDIKSVVFTTDSYGKVSFTNSVKDRIGRNIIKLKGLAPNMALKIAKSRLGGSRMLPDNVLRQLYRYSNKNLREFLQNCSLLCSNVASQDREKAKITDIKELKKEEEIKENDETDVCEECGGRLAQIGEYWRCGNCDHYCGKCGCIASEEKICPECGAEAVEGK